MSELALRVENLSKIYRLYGRPLDRLKEALDPLRRSYHQDFYALRDFSLDVRRGETVGVIGRNGSGKSTLLKLVTGILTPTTGQVEVDGRVAALLELGAGFNPELTGLENIYFSGAIMGCPRREMDGRVESITSFADIGVYIHQPVKTYSSGMFVRLAFAVAANVDPDILVIDEALAVGDIAFQAKCYRKFAEFRKAGKTIVFVTHALDSVIRYCDRAVVLDAGRKVAETGPKEAVDIYKRLMTESQDLGTDVPPDAQAGPDAGEAALLKSGHTVHSDMLSYGDGRARIVDFALLDDSGRPAQKLVNFSVFRVVMKVRFDETIEDPIFAFTIKDVKGLEITGTNTFFLNVDTGRIEKGRTVTVAFAQPLNLQSGQYALSLGCTGFESRQFAVYHRLYDVLLFEVVSDRQMVGFFDPRSEVTMEVV